MPNNNYNPRTPSAISRDNSFSEKSQKEPSWYNDFINNLQKTSVHSKRDDYSIFEQINEVVGNKSGFASVEEKVNSLKERVGLTKLLNVKAQLQETNKLPEIFQECPEMKTFIDNYVAVRPGTSVEAVMEDLLKINQIKQKLPDNHDLPEDVKRYIDNKIAQELNQTSGKSSDNMQLGKVDLTIDKNIIDDPLAMCMPARDQSR